MARIMQVVRYSLWEIQQIMHGDVKVCIPLEKSKIYFVQFYSKQLFDTLLTGIDTVITQMLNQMDNAGPPPLSKEKIDSVERTEVSEEQVAQNLQCSVCWENFEKMEPVRKLPCTVSKTCCCYFSNRQLSQKTRFIDKM